MKNWRKVLSIVLVLAMAFSLFTGLNLADFSDAVEVKADVTYNVLEVVPDSAVAEFHQFEQIKDEFKTKYNAEKAEGTPAISTVNVITVSPSELADNTSVIDTADLIIINQTGTNGAVSGKSFKNVDLTWDLAYKLFKKIAGVESKPCSFIIDRNIYKSISKNVTEWYSFYTARYDDQSNDADFLDVAASGIAGTSNNAFKLFLMLEELNPATFYGIYIENNGASWGIDEKDGSILGVGYDYHTQTDNGVSHPTKGTVFDPGKHHAVWSEAALYPYFMDNSSIKIQAYSKDWNNSSLVSSLDWKFDFSNYGDGSGNSVVRNDGTLFISSKGFGKVIKDAGSSSADLANIVNNALAFSNGTKKNDGKTYRFAIVTPNTMSADYNRCIIYDIIGSDRSHRYLGGIKVDCMSMYTFVNLSNKLSDTYDCIFFTGDGSKYAVHGGNLNLNGSEYQQWVSGLSSAYSAGNDLSPAKKDELDSFSGVILNNTSNPTSGTLIASYLSGKNTGFNASTIISSIRSNSSVSLLLTKTPNIYNAKTEFDFLDENGGYSYQSADEYDSTYSNYINDKDHPSRYTLDFKFTAAEPGTYTVNIYVDYNSDGFFDTASGGYGSDKKRFGGEKVKSTEVTLTEDDMIASVSASPVPSGYVGPVTWKFEIEKGGKKDFEIGYSACRSTSSDTKQSVHLLQIVPDDDKSQWGASTERYTISMLLPTKEEIFKADWNHKSTSDNKFKLGNIGSYQTKKSSSQLDSIKQYFSNCITTKLTNGTYDTLTWDGSIRNSQILSNIGLYYYFMYKEKDYDISVTRMSVSEFNTAVGTTGVNGVSASADGRLIYPEKVGFDNKTEYDYIYNFINGYSTAQLTQVATDFKNRVSAANGKDVNLDLIFTTAGWEIKAVDASSNTALCEGWDNVPYLKQTLLNTSIGATDWDTKLKASDDTGYIIRIAIDSANNVSVVKENPATESKVSVSCDLLMFGFCSGMQEFSDDAVTKIYDHINKGFPVFIGKGGVSAFGSNKLSQKIRSLVGMDRFNVTSNAGGSTAGVEDAYSLSSYASGSKYKFQGLTDFWEVRIDNECATITQTNDTVLSHYPYYIPDRLKATAGRPNYFQLEMDYSGNENRLVVAYAKYLSNAWDPNTIYGKWGDTRSMYYMYKKNNVTFACIGHNSDKVDGSQRGGIFTLPEAALLVNALIAASERDINGSDMKAYVTCTDPDSSSVTIPGATSGQGNTYKDFVYVDYDGTKTGMSGDGSTPIENPSIVTVDGVAYRKIPYKATVATTAEIAIYKDYDKTTKNGTILPIKVEKSDGTALTNNGTPYHYNVSNGETYYLYVPIQDSGFQKIVQDAGMNSSVANGLGLTNRDDFKLDLVVTTDGDNTKQTYNELTVVRRGMFLIN